MQVSVEQKSELKRKMKVQVPEDRIQSEIDKRLHSLAQKVKIDGFRPGKVPAGIIKRRYGGPVRNEVVGELIQSSLIDALRDHDFRPAGVPSIENTVTEVGNGLEFEASFEIYPEIEIAPYKDLKFVRPVCEISESDIDAMVEKLRHQRREWQTVERESSEKDRLTISFSGTVGEENFTDGTVNDFEVEIGSQQMIPGFEENLIGLKADSEKKFTVEFPKGYGNENLSGKPADFNVHVKKVEESIVPEVDEEFIKQFGVESGDINEFRASLKSNMEQEKDRALQSRTKTAVMEAMLQMNTVVLPDVMVDAEIAQVKKQHSPQPGEPELSEEQLNDYESEARRRVTLGLLLAEIIKKNSLKTDGARVRKTVESLAQSYNSPDDVVNWYYSNPEQLQKIEHLVLEEQVVDLIVQDASATDEEIEFASLTTQN